MTINGTEITSWWAGMFFVLSNSKLSDYYLIMGNHIQKFKFGEPTNSYQMKMNDQYKTDMSRHDLLVKLKECKL